MTAGMRVDGEKDGDFRTPHAHVAPRAEPSLQGGGGLVPSTPPSALRIPRCRLYTADPLGMPLQTSCCAQLHTSHHPICRRAYIRTEKGHA